MSWFIERETHTSSVVCFCNIMPLLCSALCTVWMCGANWRYYLSKFARCLFTCCSSLFQNVAWRKAERVEQVQKLCVSTYLCMCVCVCSLQAPTFWALLPARSHKRWLGSELSLRIDEIRGWGESRASWCYAITMYNLFVSFSISMFEHCFLLMFYLLYLCNLQNVFLSTFSLAFVWIYILHFC